MAGFQKTDFGISSAEGAGNTKIGFIMRTAGVWLLIHKLIYKKVLIKDLAQ